MFFPKLEEIATVDFMVVSGLLSIKEVTKVMQDNNLNDIIVRDEEHWKLVTTNLLINCKINNISLDTKINQLSLDIMPTFSKDINYNKFIIGIKKNDRYICVLDNGILYGIVSYGDIISSIDPETMMEAQTVGDMITRYIPTILNINSKLKDAFFAFKNNSTDSIIILDNDKPVGILTLKDILNIFASGVDLNRGIKEFMSSPLLTVDEDITIKESVEFVQSKKFNRIVVLNKDKTLLGVISKKELISFTYSKWANLLKNHQEELREINKILDKKAKHFEKLANYDQLTDLPNRLFFQVYLKKAVKQTIENNLMMAVLMLDIDHFKSINDTYGHLIGDNVLQKISSIIQNMIRKTDFAARWGGEEFMILLPHTTLKNAVIVAEKLRTAIQKTKFANVNQVTASFGVVENQEFEDKIFMIDRVDTALYEAKESGRNKVVFKEN